MPKYRYPLTNGKTLTLEGDSEPSDDEVMQHAKDAGVTVKPSEEFVAHQAAERKILADANAKPLHEPTSWWEGAKKGWNQWQHTPLSQSAPEIQHAGTEYTKGVVMAVPDTLMGLGHAGLHIAKAAMDPKAAVNNAADAVIDFAHHPGESIRDTVLDVATDPRAIGNIAGLSAVAPMLKGGFNTAKTTVKRVAPIARKVLTNPTAQREMAGAIGAGVGSTAGSFVPVPGSTLAGGYAGRKLAQGLFDAKGEVDAAMRVPAPVSAAPVELEGLRTTPVIQDVPAAVGGPTEVSGIDPVAAASDFKQAGAGQTDATRRGAFAHQVVDSTVPSAETDAASVWPPEDMMQELRYRALVDEQNQAIAAKRQAKVDNIGPKLQRKMLNLTETGMTPEDAYSAIFGDGQ